MNGIQEVRGSTPLASTMNINQLYITLCRNHDKPLLIMLPNGEFVPENFHVTEVGKVTKQFIDCGGTERETIACVLQVWVANDVDHRLKSNKLAKILELAEPLVGATNGHLPVEIEYGSEYVSQYPLGDVEVTPGGLLFVLGAKKTACLAPDKCGVIGCC